MSRDFLISFDEENHQKEAKDILNSLCLKGEKLFDIDERRKSLFVTLAYNKNITETIFITNKGVTMKKPFFEYISLVALKNGQHHQDGYFIDSKFDNHKSVFEIKDIFEKVISHFN